MTDARNQDSPGSVVNFQSREQNGAFGLAARVGERVAERTDQKAEWSGGFGNSSREPQRGSQVCRVWRRSLSRGSQSRQVLATGRANGVKRDTRGPRCLVFQPERPGVKRSPICEGPDAQSERSETEHRSRSKWASKRNGRVFRLSDKLKSGAVGVRQFCDATASHEGEAQPKQKLVLSQRKGDAQNSKRRRC